MVQVVKFMGLSKPGLFANIFGLKMQKQTDHNLQSTPGFFSEGCGFLQPYLKL